MMCCCRIVRHDDGDEIVVCPLCAAAPDLLAACEGLLTCSLPVDVSGQRFVDAACAAIAKAKGK